MKFWILALTFSIATLFAGTALAQSCPAGYNVPCGNVCCENGAQCGGGCGSTCCKYVNNPGGGGGSCPTGYPNDCGNGRCCPSGSTCGGSCGGECCSSGGGNQSNNPNTGNQPSTGGDTDICQTFDAGPSCTKAQACAGPKSGAYYNVDGKIIKCGTTTCEPAAREVADLCAAHSKSSGCSVGPASNDGNGTIIGLGILVGAVIVGSRLRRRHAA